tara:strand:+ start:59 stop:280 length:222 start_codon:yes stop_codon:yes gene_type:complete
MKNQEIKFKNKNHNYSIIVGKNSINILPKKIKLLCPKSKKIAFIIDKNVPIKFKANLKKKIKKLPPIILIFFS